MWKKKSTYVIIFLVLVLLGNILFLNIIHVPYITYHNHLDEIESEIMEQEGIRTVSYFNEYNTSQTYYILLTSSRAYVYNSKLKCIYENPTRKLHSTDELLSVDSYKELEEEYGYENDVICYVYKITLEDNTIQYRYYNLETGQLIKMYSLKDE